MKKQRKGLLDWSLSWVLATVAPPINVPAIVDAPTGYPRIDGEDPRAEEQGEVVDKQGERGRGNVEVALEAEAAAG
ncbi:hypothetical protein E2562_012863 [Oryza meyeriana var. granulata]|uniref:DUF834 domain-containing protein n=1 Tax=Oryza meyeriana var. granulata TaxID=110450 RepID=A0A6G1CQZ2_9ORYZ|nr:hypothetical protein E2562_012863 [Oryza meyeriana var. granulata]